MNCLSFVQSIVAIETSKHAILEHVTIDNI